MQKALNALYGAVRSCAPTATSTVKLIADLYEMPAEIAALEYENTIMKLETNGNMAARQRQRRRCNCRSIWPSSAA